MQENVCVGEFGHTWFTCMVFYGDIDKICDVQCTSLRTKLVSWCYLLFAQHNLIIVYLNVLHVCYEY